YLSRRLRSSAWMVVVPKAGTTRIEGLVGTGYQALGSVVLPHLSQADGEGAVGTALAEGLGDRFEDGLSVRQVGAGQDADELVAAVAKDHVVGTEPLGDHPRQRDQQFVALRVPDVVVEPLEPVDIDEGDDQPRVRLAEGAPDLARQREHAVPSAEDPGQLVDGSLLFELVHAVE